jgi:predicted lipase
MNNLSSRFLAKLCWVINYNFTNQKYQKETLIMYGLTTKSHSNINLVVFKSSDSKEDWETNYDFRLVPMKPTPTCCFGCAGMFSSEPFVHRGFLDQYNIINTKLSRFLHSRKDSSFTIFTGFSLGGALATLASCLCDVPNIYTFTFGSPKVGNSNFVKTFTENKAIRYSERWVFQNDPIPRLPPGNIYKHIPGFKMVRKDSDQIYEVENCYWKYLSRSAREDHDIIKFLLKISDKPLHFYSI